MNFSIFYSVFRKYGHTPGPFLYRGGNSVWKTYSSTCDTCKVGIEYTFVPLTEESEKIIVQYIAGKYFIGSYDYSMNGSYISRFQTREPGVYCNRLRLML